MKRIVLWTIALCLSACSATYPVKGVVDKTKERFLGTATASMMEENATIDIVMDSGAKCSGSYPRPRTSSGGVSASGTFTCDDGRTGNFAFGGTPQGGEGFGKFNDGKKFTFIYGRSGDADSDLAAAMALQSLGQSAKPMPTPAVSTSTPPLYVPTHPVSCTSSPSMGGTYIQTNCY